MSDKRQTIVCVQVSLGQFSSIFDYWSVSILVSIWSVCSVYIDYGSHGAYLKFKLAPRRSISNVKSVLELSLRQPVCLSSSLLGARGVSQAQVGK